METYIPSFSLTKFLRKSILNPLKLSKKEENLLKKHTKSKLFISEEEDIQDPIENLPVSILRNFVIEKFIHRGFIQYMVQPHNFSVKELETSIFKITIEKYDDHNHILNDDT